MKFKGFDLSEYDKPEKVKALITFLQIEKPENETDILVAKLGPGEITIEEDNTNEFEVKNFGNHTETWAVFTDEEAEQEFDDYFDSDTFREEWVEAVRHGGCDEGLKDYIENKRAYAGRGEILSYYNGVEEEQQIDGVMYYLYRR